MLTGIHFLLTYECNLECDHCFLFCGPHAGGTFTLEQMRKVFSEIDKIGTVKAICFEGGEPFLYYPLMMEGIRLAGEKGLRTGMVTNAYWASDVEDALLWLSPLQTNPDFFLHLSDDLYHHESKEDNPARKAYEAAIKLSLEVDTITIDEPDVKYVVSEDKKGEPVVEGNVLFKGRAAEKLTEGLPTKSWESFTSCDFEELEKPKRLHIDSFGNVHICQGLSMGNMWETPLSQLVSEYDPHSHPICAPLLDGGPARLAREYNVEHDDQYVSQCHLCYMVRKALIDRFPQYLAPRQVYGLE
jgi:organic radical activating enzyme